MLREEAGVAICEACRPTAARQQEGERRKRGRAAVEEGGAATVQEHTRIALLKQRRNPKWKPGDPPHQEWLPDKVEQRKLVRARAGHARRWRR